MSVFFLHVPEVASLLTPVLSRLPFSSLHSLSSSLLFLRLWEWHQPLHLERPLESVPVFLPKPAHTPEDSRGQFRVFSDPPTQCRESLVPIPRPREGGSCSTHSFSHSTNMEHVRHQALSFTVRTQKLETLSWLLRESESHRRQAHQPRFFHKRGGSPRRELGEQNLRSYPACGVRRAFLEEVGHGRFAGRSWRGSGAKGGTRTKTKAGQACVELSEASGSCRTEGVCPPTQETLWKSGFLPAPGVGLSHGPVGKDRDTPHGKP